LPPGETIHEVLGGSQGFDSFSKPRAPD
jgi:hypothetical protein